MRIRVLSGIFFLIVIFLSVSLFYPFREFRFPWEAQRVTSVYTSLLESTGDALLNSSEYSLKIIFPYDFIEREDLDSVPWRDLQRLYDTYREDYLLRENPELYPDRKIPDEWKYAALYRLCRENGLDPASDPRSFVVIAAGIKAGIRLMDRESYLISVESGEDKTLKLRLPPADITDIIIIDRPVEDQGFPEVRITPQQWSSLIDTITPGIIRMAVDKGILEEAERSAVSLLKGLFEGAGFDIGQIEFSL